MECEIVLLKVFEWKFETIQLIDIESNNNHRIGFGRTF